MDDVARIRASYDRDPEREWRRLVGGAQARLEWLITRQALSRHLPLPGPSVQLLDAGGGPGRYTLELAHQGYCVTLYDLSPALLELARQRLAAAEPAVRARVAAVIEGSITALDRLPSDHFAAVLCLGGVLSHLPAATARRDALAELGRVLHPDGRLMITALNRIGAFRSAVQWPDAWTQFMPHFLERGDGVMGPDRLPTYSFWPEEFVGEITAAGFVVEALYGCQGIGAHLPETHLLALMADQERWPLWQRALLETCARPDIVGVSNHLLVVARQAASDQA